MPTKTYRIAKRGKDWVVLEGDVEGMTYVTQEAAFEAAAAAASADLRTGNAVRIEAGPPTDPAGARGGEPAPGNGFSA
jgi:hypothetical protein